MKGWHYESYRHSLAARGVRTSFVFPRVHYPIQSLPLEELNPMTHLVRKEDFDEDKLADAEDLLKELRDLKLVEGRKPTLVAAFIVLDVKEKNDLSKLPEVADKYGVYPGTLRVYRREYLARKGPKELSEEEGEEPQDSLAAKSFLSKKSELIDVLAPETETMLRSGDITYSIHRLREMLREAAAERDPLRRADMLLKLGEYRRALNEMVKQRREAKEELTKGLESEEVPEIDFEEEMK